MATATAFYPSLSYGVTPTVINFGASEPREVASLIEINEAAIRKQNVAEDGTTETLFLRIETQVRLSFQFLTKATIDAIRTWWRTHAALGLASGLKLDRLETAAGQLEYDTYNTFFTTAELVDVQWQPRRTTPRGIHYALSLTFRQGTPPYLVQQNQLQTQPRLFVRFYAIPSFASAVDYAFSRDFSTGEILQPTTEKLTMLMKVAGVAQSISPELGQSTIGQFTLTFQDRAGEILRHMGQR